MKIVKVKLTVTEEIQHERVMAMAEDEYQEIQEHLKRAFGDEIVGDYMSNSTRKGRAWAGAEAELVTAVD